MSPKHHTGGISAVILAAGYSRRMGNFKPLLRFGAQTLLERLVSTYRKAGIADIRVVTGHRAAAVEAALVDLPVTTVHNPIYDTGMFSSILAGIDSLPSTTRAFFIHPVDIPLVRPDTLSRLMTALDDPLWAVVYPLLEDQRGHPPLIHSALATEIAAYNGCGGLRELLRRFESRAKNIPVADAGVLLDLDTPDDYQRLAARAAQTGHVLTATESRMLMEKILKLPLPVVEHCRQVARVAAALAKSVAKCVAGIDIQLVEAAATVHDLARDRDSHAAVGAEWLNAMGFPAMAAIVAAHMDIDVSQDSPLDETQIVYLADKLVTGKTVIDLKQRFATKLAKYRDDPDISATIVQRRQAAQIIQGKIETLSGETVYALLTNAGIPLSQQQGP